jgi:hypothetical protein
MTCTGNNITTKNQRDIRRRVNRVQVLQRCLTRDPLPMLTVSTAQHHTELLFCTLSFLLDVCQVDSKSHSP